MSTPARRVAVTGAGGRLGTALVRALDGRTGTDPLAWGRADLDLDRPGSIDPLLARHRPDLVLHAAAWTDVDGCARDPALAMRRNADVTDRLARACAASGTALLVVSTNEVFDGARQDGRGYREEDPTGPRNAYGVSKLAGEDAARARFGTGGGLWVVRTAWLYGPPGNDFPAKVVAAADRLPPGDALPVVADETGSPTWTPDLAAAILALVAATDGGTFHLVNGGQATRLAWARAVLAERRPERALRPISLAEFPRASDPPPWAVLDTSRAAAAGVVLREWRAALAAAMAAGTTPPYSASSPSK